MKNTMKEPPPMISIKDSLYIYDILAVTLTLYKKHREYEEQVVDKEVKKQIKNTKDNLGQIYHTMLEVIA